MSSGVSILQKIIITVDNNTELNDLRKKVCFRKSDLTVEGISACDVIEKLIEHGINCLPCSNDVTVATKMSYVCQNDVIGMPFCPGTKH